MSQLRIKIKVATTANNQYAVKGFGELHGKVVTVFSYMSISSTDDELLAEAHAISGRIVQNLVSQNLPPAAPVPPQATQRPSNHDFSWN